MSTTFIVLCVGASLLFFLLRRLEAKEKSCPNFIPDYGLKPEWVSKVPSIVKTYGKKADSQFTCACLLPHSIKSFFTDYESFCLDGDGVVLARRFIETPYRENDDFVQIGTLSYGEDAILARKNIADDNIYIVSCEDGDPANPEVYATSLEDFIAMCIGQYLLSGE